MNLTLLGTPVICPKCKHEDKIRLFRGVRLKNILCEKCGFRGLKRNTDYDKERRKLESAILPETWKNS